MLPVKVVSVNPPLPQIWLLPWLRLVPKLGLIDADIYGPSIPTMFNCEFEQPTVKQVNGKNIITPIEQYGVKLISIGFLTPPDSAVVWRGPMASSALKQFFSDADWGELDYLLIDLPPGTSDIHLTMVQTVPVTGAVIVTTPQKVALADANKAMAMFKQPQINVPILGIIENMAYFTPEELPNNKYYMFGQGGGKNLSEKYNVPLLGQIPIGTRHPRKWRQWTSGSFERRYYSRCIQGSCGSTGTSNCHKKC